MIHETIAGSKRKQSQVLKNTAWVLGFSFNQAVLYFAVFTFDLQIQYYLAATFILTFIFSVSLENLSRALLYSITSMVIGAFIALVILLIPPITLGPYSMVDFTISIYSAQIAKISIFNLPISTISAIIGGLISEK